MSLLSIIVPERLGSPIWGVIIPALIFLVAFSLTYWLYRRFSRGMDEQQDQSGASNTKRDDSSGKDAQR